MSILLHQVLANRTLHPNNLGILRGKKSWLLHLDIVVLSDAGNIYDAMFMAARAALWCTKVPRTRGVEYKASKGGKGPAGFGGTDVGETMSGFNTRQIPKATDFELHDYWDEGEMLDGRERWPVCVTLNLVFFFGFGCSSCTEYGRRSVPPTTWTRHYQKKPLHHINYCLYFHFRRPLRRCFREYVCLVPES